MNFILSKTFLTNFTQSIFQSGLIKASFSCPEFILYHHITESVHTKYNI